MDNRAFRYRQLAEELRLAKEAEARAAADRVEIIARLGSGHKAITGKSLVEVGDKLEAAGFRMKKARPLGEESSKIVVPHKDGFKEAIVSIRKRAS